MTQAHMGSVVVACPRCGARFAIDDVGLRKDLQALVLCTACGRGSLLGETAMVPVDHGPDPTALDEATWPRVIVGHEVPAAARVIADTLRRGGFAPVCVRSGDAVLSAVDPAMPAPASAVVVDVGVPGILAFEVIDGLRRNPVTAGIPIVLLASVYEKTRYKRRPNRLYGADAYLELHHVPDRLVEVLRSTLAHRPVATERQQAPLDRARATALRTDGVGSFDGGATAMARRLLSDMALYHGDEIARGVREGQPFAHIPDAVDAARSLHVKAGGAALAFDQELKAFAARLMEQRQTTDEMRG